MALRVLLADESSTIKKAIQMALSDLGVDVKSVPSGLDVLTVSRSFQPDLILADVLLTKKNGYEVCAEIKADSQLRTTPVILMWSSFLQLDQTQYHNVKADASLEKPFDVEGLRQLVEKYVPKVKSFPLRGFLNHPELPPFEESETFVKQRTDFLNAQKAPEPQPVAPNSAQPQPAAPTAPNLPPSPQMYKMQTSALSNQDAIDDMDEFSEVPLTATTQTQTDDWSSTSAQQFVVETESFGDFEEVTVMASGQQAEPTADLRTKINEQISDYIKDSPIASSKRTKSQTSAVRGISSLDEQIMKEEIRMMAEKICWQILPEMMEKIVREEISKLLNGLEKN